MAVIRHKKLLLVLALLPCSISPACIRFIGQSPSQRDSHLDLDIDAAAVDAGPSDVPAPDRITNDAAVDVVADADADAGLDPLRPFNSPQLVTVSSPDAEDDPTLTADMLEIYFNRKGDIWRATRSSITGNWSVPAVATALSSTANETNPEIIGDGLAIYFASNRTHPHASGTFDIYLATRATRGTAWSAPAPVVALNTPEEDHPGISTDDLIMFITSTRPGVLGEYDFFETSRAAAGQPWGPVTWVKTVSTTELEVSPWIDATGTVLFFSSVRGGLPEVKIWAAVRSGPAQTFSPPQLVNSLDHGDKDEDPWLSPDLRTVYFASRPSGTTDMNIYTATR